MIDDILKLLRTVEDTYGVSEAIDIAKGKYMIPLTFSDAIEKIKRNKKYKD